MHALHPALVRRGEAGREEERLRQQDERGDDDDDNVEEGDEGDDDDDDDDELADSLPPCSLCSLTADVTLIGDRCDL